MGSFADAPDTTAQSSAAIAVRIDSCTVPVETREAKNATLRGKNAGPKQYSAPGPSRTSPAPSVRRSRRFPSSRSPARTEIAYFFAQTELVKYDWARGPNTA